MRYSNFGLKFSFLHLFSFWCIGRADSETTNNRPFPSSLVPLFQNESKCETFHMKMSSACSFISMQIKVISRNNGFALRLALKQRHKGTRKWPIVLIFGKALKVTSPLLASESRRLFRFSFLFRSLNVWNESRKLRRLLRCSENLCRSFNSSSMEA